MASDILCRDGKTLLPKWWIDQEIHKRDPAGWREIMIATNAVLNKMQKVGNIQMDKLPITPESIVSVTDGEEVMIGKVISITQDRVRVQKLVEDTSSKDNIRKTCKDIGSWFAFRVRCVAVGLSVCPASMSRICRRFCAWTASISLSVSMIMHSCSLWLLSVKMHTRGGRPPCCWCWPLATCGNA
jgi:hypothetical protein